MSRTATSRVLGGQWTSSRVSRCSVLFCSPTVFISSTLAILHFTNVGFFLEETRRKHANKLTGRHTDCVCAGSWQPTRHDPQWLWKGLTGVSFDLGLRSAGAGAASGSHSLVRSLADLAWFPGQRKNGGKTLRTHSTAQRGSPLPRSPVASQPVSQWQLQGGLQVPLTPTHTDSPKPQSGSEAKRSEAGGAEAW